MRLQLSVNIKSSFFFFRAPSTKRTSTRIFQGQGEQIISCDTYGVPQPIVLPNWWKNGTRLSVSRASSVLGSNHRLIINENNSLVIRQPTRKDEGAYSCETLQVYENSAGKRQKLVFYVVVGKSLFHSISQGHTTDRLDRISVGSRGHSPPQKFVGYFEQIHSFYSERNSKSHFRNAEKNSLF